MPINASQLIDANFKPIGGGLSFRTKKVMTFAGGTLNDPGDFDGSGNPATLFTVTGTVLVCIIGVCSVDLTGASATIEVGVNSYPDLLLSSKTATNITSQKVWVLNDLNYGGDAQISDCKATVRNIIQTVATADITAGVITYYCLWTPLSSDGLVVAA